MSYEELKRRIDTMRNILVGAVPSPAGQIDQITYALMYKFMNDIDDQSVALGGKRKYFAGDYAKYNWHELMSSQLGAHDRLELYRQAIQTMAKNPGLPELFREIFQNAFLPFNSPSVLNLFLKEVNKFDIDEGDSIGDAYEYLLSITGAQGDVGQFRTPRHIIKFIVEAVNPTKDDEVLDPAVGTAGFLIAAYNHVKSQHDGRGEDGERNDEVPLTADERAKLYRSYRGFDIDPTMVRISRVNMYLHGFTKPNIENHDTLSSEDYWDKRYDVILANPPFMTPKGGIQPHKKFRIVANRAEVLFVDYIASHLKPSGRAGIIVPEGIIFQSGNAYKQLRKNLVENYIYAVVSLPAGVFQPYSGVKTSVLLLDRELAKANDNVLFVNIQNDGYSLGSQRRPITGEQFTGALRALEQYREGSEVEAGYAHTVSRAQIIDSGDYNLSGDRYRTVMAANERRWPLVKLEDIFTEIKNGKNVRQVDNTGRYRVSRIQTIASGKVNLEATKFTNDEVSENDFLKPGDILFSHINSYEHLAKTALFDETESVVHGANLLRLRPDTTRALAAYLSFVLKSDLFRSEARRFAQKAVNQASINSTSVKNLEVPLPPMEVQHEIVGELDGYQQIIEAAQVIVDTYRPVVEIDPSWDVVPLGNVVKIGTGKKDVNQGNPQGEYPFFTCAREHTFSDEYSYDFEALLIAGNGDVGNVKYYNGKFEAYQRTYILSEFRNVEARYLYYLLGSTLKPILEKQKLGNTMPYIKLGMLSEYSTPLPPIEIQREIVTRLDNEANLVDASRQLINIYTQKISDKISEIWGE